MTPKQKELLDYVFLRFEDGLSSLEMRAKVHVMWPANQDELKEGYAKPWWPRRDNKLEVLLLDPLTWNVDLEWLFGCVACGRSEGWIDRIDNGARFCPECWEKGEQNNPRFANFQQPFDWVVVRGRDKPVHPTWIHRTHNVLRIRNIPLYVEGWGDWVSKDEVATRWTDDNSERLSEWQYREGWLERVRGCEWGCLNLDGEYMPYTTTWNGHQRNPRDNEEVTVFKVGEAAGVMAVALLGDEYRQFPVRSFTW